MAKKNQKAKFTNWFALSKQIYGTSQYAQSLKAFNNGKTIKIGMTVKAPDESRLRKGIGAAWMANEVGNRLNLINRGGTASEKEKQGISDLVNQFPQFFGFEEGAGPGNLGGIGGASLGGLDEAGKVAAGLATRGLQGTPITGGAPSQEQVVTGGLPVGAQVFEQDQGEFATQRDSQVAGLQQDLESKQAQAAFAATSGLIRTATGEESIGELSALGARQSSIAEERAQAIQEQVEIRKQLESTQSPFAGVAGTNKPAVSKPSLSVPGIESVIPFPADMLNSMPDIEPYESENMTQVVSYLSATSQIPTTAQDLIQMGFKLGDDGNWYGPTTDEIEQSSFYSPSGETSVETTQMAQYMDLAGVWYDPSIYTGGPFGGQIGKQQRNKGRGQQKANGVYGQGGQSGWNINWRAAGWG